MSDSPVIYPLWRRAAALGVHLFTASGIVSAFFSLVAIHHEEWRNAMIFLWICFVIDGFDGLLARLARVRDVLPNWDGEAIDDVIDFCTYAVIPAYFMYASPMLLDAGAWRTALPALVLLTSAMYYGHKGMVSTDKYFVGFPVLWNFVIFYQFFVFQTSSFTTIISTLIICVLHFVPFKVPYPSQVAEYRWLQMGLIIAAISANFLILFDYPNPNRYLILFSEVYLAYLGVWSLYATFKK